MSEDQEAFERAKRAWEELNEVWERGALQSEEARRALHGLREALDGLIDFTQKARDEAPRSEGDGG
jgi:hypothetical protein